MNLFQKKFIWPRIMDAKLSLSPNTGQGLMMVTFGKALRTMSSASYFVWKSRDGELGSAPAAEKWMSLCTPCLVQALAILSAASMLIN